MKRTQSRAKGFTLLEILLVVGIISILAGIVILAVNPTRQLGDTRNAQRRSDVLTILNAVYQYSIDNPGGLDTITNDDLALGVAEAVDCGSAEGTDASELSEKLAGTDQIYLVEIPHDPVDLITDDDFADSEYFLVQDGSTKRITVCAPNSFGEGNIALEADGGEAISVTR